MCLTKKRSLFVPASLGAASPESWGFCGVGEYSLCWKQICVREFEVWGASGCPSLQVCATKESRPSPNYQQLGQRQHCLVSFIDGTSQTKAFFFFFLPAGSYLCCVCVTSHLSELREAGVCQRDCRTGSMSHWWQYLYVCGVRGRGWLCGWLKRQGSNHHHLLSAPSMDQWLRGRMDCMSHFTYLFIYLVTFDSMLSLYSPHNDSRQWCRKQLKPVSSLIRGIPHIKGGGAFKGTFRLRSFEDFSPWL